MNKRTFYKAFYVAMVITALGMVGIMGGITILNVTQPKYSIATYHFNVQYRAGDAEAMIEVVNNSLLPILYMYDRHPTWRANIEFQAMMIEELALVDNLTTSNTSLKEYGDKKPYGSGMQLLQTLVNRGEIELIILQYSDALCVAYPYLAWYMSINYTQQVLQKYHIHHVCRAVQLQEGQFLFGLSRVMADYKYANGTPIYDTMLVMTDVLNYYHVQTQAPIYTWKVQTSTGASWNSTSNFYVVPYWILPSEEGTAFTWSIWCQDGENVDTSFESTYVAENFAYSDVKLKNHEAQIEAMEQEGNTFMTISEWENLLLSPSKPLGSPMPLDSFVTETNWQAFSYRGAFRWMGKNGVGNNDDGQIIAHCYRAYQELQAVDILLNYSYFGIHNLTRSQYENCSSILANAWACLAAGMGTDTTGLDPGFQESNYGFVESGYALGNATRVKNYIQSLNPTLKSTFQVVPFNFDPLVQWDHANQNTTDWSSTIVTNASKFINFTRVGAASLADLAPVSLTLMNTRNVNISKYQVETKNALSIGNQSYYSVSLNFVRDNESTNASLNQPDWQYIKFNGDFSNISYSPTMYENETVMLERNNYYPDAQDPYGDWSGGPKETLTDNFEIYLPLSNGMVYSENEHFAIVKNNTADHIAGKWNTNDLRFMQTDTNNDTAPVQFFVLTNVTRTQALAFANLVNTWKQVTITQGDLK